MKMYMKLALATTVLSLVAGPAMAHHTNAHVRAIANQEITKRKPELRGQTGATGAQGPQGIPGVGTPGPRGLPGASGGFKLLDSLGVEVGHVMQTAPRYARTLITIGGLNIAVDVLPNAYVSPVPISHIEFFTSLVCTGPRYFRDTELWEVFPLVTPSLVDGSIVYVLDHPALINIPEGVQYSHSTGGAPCVTATAGPGGVNLIPLTTLGDLNTLFTPPFNIGL